MFASRDSLDQDLYRHVHGMTGGAQVAPDVNNAPNHGGRYLDDLRPTQAELGSVLAACEVFVSERLREGHVVHAVLGSGLFGEEDAALYEQAQGAPYVLVGVDSEEASVFVQRALRDVALNDPTSWMCDWESIEGASHAFKVAIDLEQVRPDQITDLSREVE